MIKQVDSFANNQTSPQDRYMEIQYGKYLENRRISENVLCYIEPKDSIDDFITKHRALLDKNINTYDSSISETTLTSDVQNIFKHSNTNPFHSFGNELLFSILLNNNLKMNKLMYTLALDTRKQKQNRRLKRFIKLLRKNHDHEVEEYNPNPANNRSSSHLTCKFSSDLSNFNEENVKDVAQSLTYLIGLGDKINKNTGNVEIQNLSKPQSILKPTILTEAVSSTINKPFSKKVQYADLQENYLDPKEIKSNLKATTSESEEREREKNNVLDQQKSLECIENIIENQIESVCFLIEDFKKQIHKEKDDVLWLQNDKNTTEIDYNIAKQKETDTNDFASIENYETAQRTGSCVFKIHNTSEDRDIYAKIGEEIQKICQKIDQPRKLENIENKIDELIDLIQFLVVVIKEQKLKEKEDNLYTPDIKNKTEKDCSALQHYKNNTINSARSLNIDKYDIIKQNSSRLFKLLEILENKSLRMENEMKRNSKRTIQANCYYGSTFKLLLTEKATEISKSIQNTEINVSEVIVTEANSVNSDKKNIDNTSKDLNTTEQQGNKETLGVLAILRLCTQFLKQLLSCVSDVHYSHLGCRKCTYLKENSGSTYTCNICEEVFCKASMLNDHIKEHEVDLVRECDVCKHVLETHKLDNGEQFECQFCKQRFMRAYCCELHQQSCAKRLGLRHDVDSNLILLQ